MIETQLCRICGKRAVSSREHVPPQSQGNIGEIDVTFIDGKDFIDKRRFHRIHKIFKKGFFLRVLCWKCNSRYGSIYNTSYHEFVKQIPNASGLQDPQGRVLIRLEDIYPLRILKQMFLMYLCVQSRQGWPDIREFVRNKNSKIPEDTPRIYLYKNISAKGRIVPWHGIGELKTKRPPITLSEISYPPIGIIFCDLQDDRFALMEDVTDWGQYKFKDRISTVIRLPQLQVGTHHPLGFGTEEDVEKWRRRCGVVWLALRPDVSPSETSVSAELRPRYITL